MMCYKVLDKKEKSSNSVISPESWFKHYRSTELFKKKTSEHHFIPEYTYLLIYLSIKTFQSVVYSVNGVITIQNHPGPN